MPKLLDLFCGEGGAGMGYHRAGFDVVGVDLEARPLKRYPFPCIRGDALEIAAAIGHRFDLVHASPPCQAYSTATAQWRDGSHPDLVGTTRTVLEATGRPFVIENVPQAPLRADVTLCGSQFGLSVKRHRAFELGGWFTMQHGCAGHDYEVIGVWGNAGIVRSDTWNSLRGRRYRNRAEARVAMGMPWASTKGCVEAIPPAYTEWIGERFLDA